MNSQENVHVDVQFRHMSKSDAIVNLVKNEAAEMGGLTVPGTRCEVVVDETQHRHLRGVSSVRIRLVVPGDRCYVVHRNGTSGSIEFIYGAICDAFEELGQLIQKRDSVQMRRQRRAIAA